MDVFSAIAEPTRREMLSILAQGERSAGELVEAFPQLTQPAVSRHLRILREAHLVEARPQAQLRIYKLRPERLRELDQWLSRYRPFWSDRLDALEQHLDKKRAAPKRGGR
ncbi:MAG TPA: metalloregulator ArsR/SmtB family transcription factor [Nitrososphaerales archaeon]|nr:metalloregulator ArsR/SmtB family transcription factor [Nitrososphaerales archaeon]